MCSSCSGRLTRCARRFVVRSGTRARAGRPGLIRPVYWEDPMPCDTAKQLPPPQLARLHFACLAMQPLVQPGLVSLTPDSKDLDSSTPSLALPPDWTHPAGHGAKRTPRSRPRPSRRPRSRPRPSRRPRSRPRRTSRWRYRWGAQLGRSPLCARAPLGSFGCGSGRGSAGRTADALHERGSCHRSNTTHDQRRRTESAVGPSRSGARTDPTASTRPGATDRTAAPRH
jgi:hypothetical protein